MSTYNGLSFVQLQDALRAGRRNGATLRPDMKGLWLAALRSGEFEQARSALRNNEGAMCCLGVACEVVRRADSLAGYWKTDPAGGFQSGTMFSTVHLPKPIAKALFLNNAKLQSEEAVGCGFLGAITLHGFERGIVESKHNVFLSDLNDEGFSFLEIADLIEEFM